MLGLGILVVLLLGISFAFTLNFACKVAEKLRFGYSLEYALHETFLELF